MAVITKYLRWGGWNNRHLVLIVLKTRSPRPRCWQGGFVWGSLSLTYRWISFLSFNIVFLVCLRPSSSSFKDTSQIGLDLPPGSQFTSLSKDASPNTVTFWSAGGQDFNTWPGWGHNSACDISHVSVVPNHFMASWKTIFPWIRVMGGGGGGFGMILIKSRCAT